MGRYHARDLLLVPGLLSLSRVPLAVLFPFSLGNPRGAFFVLVTAGLTDVFDGWYARRFGQVTATGSALDPITDKLFVMTVAISLVASHHLSVGAVVLLSTREIAELPLVLWWGLSRRARGKRAENPSANIPGKIATALQFASVSAALFHSPYANACIGATSIAGLIAGATYWRRALAPVAGRDTRT